MLPASIPSASGPVDAGVEPAPAIDQAALGQLWQLDPAGTSNIVHRVLETYHRSLVKAMAEFATARAASDLATLGRIAHTLRSSSTSVGALLFAVHCKDVEMMVREGRTAELNAPLDALQIESVRVQAAIAAMLTAKGPAP